jgi:monovalent cation:H+ antiporter-2, CPA2 family
MEELALIRDLAIVWLVALTAGYLCVRLRQPLIAGYLLAGVAIGPHGIKLISETHQISALSELGVALLLFSLGVEMSLKETFASNKKVIIAGLAQVVLTIAVFWGGVQAAGLTSNLSTGFLIGCICALSSTAVVTKLLLDRAENDSNHGKIIIPMLVVQDLSLVPVMVILPLLQHSSQNMVSEIFVAIVKAVVLIAIVVLGSMKVVPFILSRVTRSNSRELFLLTVITLCLGVALLSQKLGVSLALGAFLAGIMVSEYPYGHQALADVLPIRDLFATVFFVSVGMLLDPAFVVSHAGTVAVAVVALVVLKAIISGLSALLVTNSTWSVILVGVSLAQIGEFSFILAALGRELGMLSPPLYNLFFAVAVSTFVISPALISSVPQILRRFVMRSAYKKMKKDSAGRRSNLTNHVILCGFGRTGRNVGLTLKRQGIPFVVIEIDAEIIDELKAGDIPYVYGDAFGRGALVRANLKDAVSLVITFPDPVAALTIIGFARSQKPELVIIARSHRTQDIELFKAAGANAIVQPEFEASIEMSRLVLLSLQTKATQIQKALDDMRTHRYALFQPDFGKTIDFSPEIMTRPIIDYAGSWYKIANSMVGKSLKELQVRKKSGANVLAIKRGGYMIQNPSPEMTLEEDDDIYVAGNRKQVGKFEAAYHFYRFCPTDSAQSADSKWVM